MFWTHYDHQHAWVNKGTPYADILLAGWGCPLELMVPQEPGHSMLVIVNYNPFEIVDQIQTYIRHYDIQQYHLKGFSMGATIISHVLPDLLTHCKHVSLFGARPQYYSEQIQTMKKQLETNPIQCMTLFFRQCFKKKSDFLMFQKRFNSNYDLNNVQAGLTYLETTELRHLDTIQCPVTLYHGQYDQIAPLTEILSWVKEDSSQIDVNMIPDQGHIFWYANQSYYPANLNCELLAE